MSLTVAALHDDGVSIALIPHTLAMTSLGAAAVGDPVNLEMDMIAKYVERLMERSDDERARARRGGRAVAFASIEDALADIRAGKIVLVVDDADRENEGDFIIAAEKCTPEAVNFMVTHGRGSCACRWPAWRLDELQIPQMVSSNGGDDTAFTVSIDYRPAITTGTSAHDRAFTARAIADASVGPRTSTSRVTSSRSAQRRAACFDAPGIPRPPSTWHGWPVCSPRGSSARS